MELPVYTVADTEIFGTKIHIYIIYLCITSFPFDYSDVHQKKIVISSDILCQHAVQ